MNFVVTLVCVCIKHAVTLTTSSRDSWWSSTYFQRIYEKTECKNHTCRFVLKWSVTFNVCWTVFFRSMNKTKQPAEETSAFPMEGMKWKFTQKATGFLLPCSRWVQRRVLEVRKGGNFTSISPKNLWAFIIEIYSMFFFTEKQLQ